MISQSVSRERSAIIVKAKGDQLPVEADTAQADSQVPSATSVSRVVVQLGPWKLMATCPMSPRPNEIWLMPVAVELVILDEPTALWNLRRVEGQRAEGCKE